MMEKRKMFKRMSDLRTVKIREVIEVVRVVGEGTDDSPARLIQEYYSFDGKILARNDGFAGKSNAS